MLNMKEMELLSPYLKGAVHLDVKEKKDGTEAIIEYSTGAKKIAQFRNGRVQLADYNKFSSIQEYVARGSEGNNKYRGNCCGKIIEQFIRYAHTKLRTDINFCDPMYGGGTSQDVVKKLDFVSNSWFGDLSSGFNVMKDSMPIIPNAIFAHPPYYVHKKKDGSLSNMPQYSGVQWGGKEDISLDDGSHIFDFSKFIKWLNELQYRLYEQLMKGGYMGILIGSSRCEGNYYDPLQAMNIMGKLDSVVIKKQNNYMSENIKYSNNSFIPIEHEYLIIIRKEDNLMIPVSITKDINVDMMKFKGATWRGLLQGCIANMGQANINQLMSIFENHPKAENNNNLRAKLRQTLNCNDVFVKVGEGVYKLNSNSVKSKYLSA